MTIQQLRCFVSAAHWQSIRRAADELYISQPAVTHHIQNLENELNVQLFQRINQQIRLTEQGKVFYKDAIDILERINMAVERVHMPATPESTLRVACETSLQVDQMPEIYRAFHEEYPDVSISNTELSGKDRNTHLKDGYVDIAFLPNDEAYDGSTFAFTKLYDGKRCCVVPHYHRLASKQFVTYDDLKGEMVILLDSEHSPPSNIRFQRSLQMHCPETEFCFSGSSLYTVPMVEAGLGIAVMPDFVCPGSEKIVLVPYYPDSPIQFGMLWLKNNQTAKLKRFVEIACEKYGQKCPAFI